MSLTTRTLRLAAALAAALSLTATAACEVRLTAKDDPSPAAASPQADAPTQGTAAHAAEDATANGAPGGATAPSVQPPVQPPAPGGAPSAEGQSAPEATCPWLAQEAEGSSPVTAPGPHYILNQNHEELWIQNDLEQLTVLSTNNEVAVNKVDHIVVSGQNATVYACNVKTITIEARAGNADIYWGGTTPPVVHDHGHNTDVEPYRK
ncbi:hypothetical protein [Actinomyces weissii]|uniref:DUF3060 domain-containing protein n=1 Tax=Actinomyces weissii TaxID=675090 RepID=A0A7T7S1R5_9ACTO|nr:hypothetical protein [Actinomyces weissii]QQM66659.1 hypothetical protein JG540_06030 [Actinomyces weissii]